MTEPTVAAMMTPGSVRSVVVVKKPESGRISSDGIGGKTFSKKMRNQTPM